MVSASFVKPLNCSWLQMIYDNFKLIISDNASTDATRDICQWYAEPDARIRYVRNETNFGLCPKPQACFGNGER